jgi:hypothetical protein
VALRNLVSLQHDDEELYDLSRGLPDGMDPPEYPSGCCFSLPKADLVKIGGEEGRPGHTMRFSAMCQVSSVHDALDKSRVELEVMMLAGEDGHYFETGATNSADEGSVAPGMSERPCICLCGPELRKLGLEADAERGDLLHIFGTARLESLSSTEYGGDRACLQITDLDYEDESEEALEH